MCVCVCLYIYICVCVYIYIYFFFRLYIFSFFGGGKIIKEPVCICDKKNIGCRSSLRNRSRTSAANLGLKASTQIGVSSSRPLHVMMNELARAKRDSNFNVQ